MNLRREKHAVFVVRSHSVLLVEIVVLSRRREWTILPACRVSHSDLPRIPSVAADQFSGTVKRPALGLCGLAQRLVAGV